MDIKSQTQKFPKKKKKKSFLRQHQQRQPCNSLYSFGNRYKIKQQQKKRKTK